MSEQFYTIEQNYQAKFYRLPKVFFTNTKYKQLKNDSKIAYAILQDRLELSIKNKWVDNSGRIYFIYTDKHLSEILNISKNHVTKVKKELIEAELLVQKRQGLNKPNISYLLKPEITESDIYQINQEENNLEAMPDKDSQNMGIQNPTPRESKITQYGNQESLQMGTNDTELNDTDLNKTEYNDHHHKDAQSINYSDTDKQPKNTELKNSGDDGDDSLKSVLNAYKDSFDKVPSQNISKKLQKDIEQNGTELVLYAINEAMEKDKTNYSYVKGILKRLQERNITSRQQAESYQYHKQPQKSAQSKEITPEWLHNKDSNQEKEITPEEQKQLEKDREAFLERLDKTWG